MEIRMNMDKTYNGFALDTTAIQLQSIDSSKIRLPYTGPLPVAAESAYVSLMMMPMQARAVLVCKRGNKDKRFVLAYTAAEIKALLDKFFFNNKGGTRFNNGLDLYSLGAWTSHYLDWKRVDAA